MTRAELVKMLAGRAKVKNLFISDKKWPLVLTTEDDDEMQHQLLTEFGGNVEEMWDGRNEAGHMRWAVQHKQAEDLLEDLRPFLWGWRLERADFWLSRKTKAAA